VIQKDDTGEVLHHWVTELFPICRSITGDGLRVSLQYISSLIPGFEIHEIPSGTKAFDWVVPDEWNIKEAYIEDAFGKRVVDFKDNSLHVVSYSTSVDLTLTRDELEPFLHTHPYSESAIPYVTSYYSPRWGFCLSQNQKKLLGEGPFHVVIDSSHTKGSLSYGDVVIKGESEEEILFSTYLCHPSMANNELSGPVVAAALARSILQMERRHYTYRFVFIPETIGSIAYLSSHLEHLKKTVRAGWVITCIGDDRSYSYLPSRNGNTLADRVSKQMIALSGNRFDVYTYLDRGSDERQYCSPQVDLPVASLMRSKYGTYPEYHSSLDDLNLVTPTGLDGGLQMMKSVVSILEKEKRWSSSFACEAQLGKRGLYPNLSTAESAKEVAGLVNVLAYCDGTKSEREIAELCLLSEGQVHELISVLFKAGLVHLGL
jgi:aminopeptidase-like protein